MVTPRLRFLTILAASIPLSACGPANTHTPPRISSVSLVAEDSAVGEERTYVWYRVSVAHDGRVDTLPGVMTDQMPLADARGGLLGIAFDSSGAVATAYHFDPATRRTERLALPRDISPCYSEATFSPLGDYLAYVAQSSEAVESAVIVRWPDLGEVVRVQAGPGFPSDVNFNHLRWVSDSEAEFAIRVESQSGAWIHVRARADGSAKVDTLAAEPSWAQHG